MTSFDEYGYLNVTFNHEVEPRADLKLLVDSGLLTIALENDQLESQVVGTPL